MEDWGINGELVAACNGLVSEFCSYEILTKTFNKPQCSTSTRVCDYVPQTLRVWGGVGWGGGCPEMHNL